MVLYHINIFKKGIIIWADTITETLKANFGLPFSQALMLIFLAWWDQSHAI